MGSRQVIEQHDGEAVSPELSPLLLAVCNALAPPVRLPDLHAALESLLDFLASPRGRTNANCWAADLFFTLDDGCDASWEGLPEPYQLLIDDIGGALHDTFRAPAIAQNFESTPEQLLGRLREMAPDT